MLHVISKDSSIVVYNGGDGDVPCLAPLRLFPHPTRDYKQSPCFRKRCSWMDGAAAMLGGDTPLY